MESKEWIEEPDTEAICSSISTSRAPPENYFNRGIVIKKKILELRDANQNSWADRRFYSEVSELCIGID